MEKLSNGGWYIHGNVRADEVLVIQHGSAFRGDEVLFIVKRHGQAIQINRRKAMHRQLLNDAKAELEATKTPGGMYLIDGEYRSYIHTGDIYRLVAKRVGEAATDTRAE